MFMQPFSPTCTSCVVFGSLASQVFVLHSSFTACMESAFMLIILSAAVSGIPSSAWPFLGTTKKMQPLFDIFKINCYHASI